MENLFFSRIFFQILNSSLFLNFITPISLSNSAIVEYLCAPLLSKKYKSLNKMVSWLTKASHYHVINLGKVSWKCPINVRMTVSWEEKWLWGVYGNWSWRNMIQVGQSMPFSNDTVQSHCKNNIDIYRKNSEHIKQKDFNLLWDQVLIYKGLILEI